MSERRTPRVLIADDEGHIRTLMKAVLGSMKCEVVGEATNGTEAVSLFREKRPDLTFLDINMPGKSGEDALQEIMEEFPDALVIMLTSVSDMESVERCISLGAQNYIRKDTPINDIRSMIKETWREFHA